MKQSELFILSSKYEGLPNVLLEAVTLKKMIISTNCPTGPEEILRNYKGGIFFEIGNHEQLSKKIILYINQKKRFLKKTNYSFEKLEKFDFNKNLYKYLEIINKILISP